MCGLLTVAMLLPPVAGGRAAARAAPAILASAATVLPTFDRGEQPPPIERERAGTRQFEHLTAQDGLSSGTVYCVTQDAQGFLWVGTSQGLNRYDGRDVRVYRHEPDDPGSLSKDSVLSILERRDGSLWVATDGGGLEWLDRDAGRFLHHQFEPGNPHSLSHNKVSTLYEDSAGVLWVGTLGGGLNRYDPTTGGFVRVRHDPQQGDSLASDYINAIYEDRSGGLWIGTTDGLDLYDRQRDRFDHWRSDPADASSLDSNEVFAILEDRLGALWVGTSGGGLNRMERQSGTFMHFRHDAGDPCSLSSDVVSDLLEDGTGTLWVGTLGGGLHHYDPVRGCFVRYQHDADDPDSLSGDYVNALFEDREGTLWIATTRALDRRARHLFRFDRFVEYDYVEAVLQQRDGTVWLGTINSLVRLDQDLREQRSFRHDPSDAGTLSKGWVQALLEDEAGGLWVGVAGGGLNRLDLETGRAARYRHAAGDPSSLSNDDVNALLEDRSGGLWVGTDGGLNRFDPQTGIFRLVPTDPGRPEAAQAESIWELLEDRQGRLWVGGWGDGLKRFDPATGRWTAYRHSSEDPRSLWSNFVTSLHEDSVGRLWVGTDGGLQRFEPATDGLRRYGAEEGLQRALVYSIAEDEAGHLWIGTTAGLSMLDPATDTFVNYRVGAAQGSDSYTTAGLRLADGEMLFAGEDGAVIFDPDEIVPNRTIPAVALVSLESDGHPVAPAQAAETITAVTLPWSRNDLDFEFAVLSLSQPERNQHAYMLEGYDGGWNWSGTDRTGRYADLPAGSYTLRLKGSNDDGIWNEAGTSIQIRVQPALWATWWFRAIGALVLVVAIGGGYRLRYATMEARSRQLQQEVASRTRELAGLNRIAAAVSSSLDLQQILASAVDKTLEVMGLEAGGIYLLGKPAPSAPEGVLRLATHRGLSPQFVAAIDNLVVGEGFSGRVLQTGKPMLVRDVANDPRLTRAVVRDSGFRSLALTPLVSRGTALGTLFAMTRSDVQFTGQDVDLLGSIGAQIGVAIENARFLENEQRRAEQFRVIAEVGRQITSILDIEQVLVQVVRLIQRSFGYDHVGIGLVEGEYVTYKVGAGRLWEDAEFQFRPARLKVGEEGITGWVAGSGEPLLIPDVRLEPRYVWMEGSRTRSELTVPIKVKGNVIGVLDVQSEQPNAFDESDLVTMQALANQAAVAIDNARLFNAEQRKLEQLHVISAVGYRATSILPVDELLDQIATLIQEALGYYHVGIGLIEGDEVVSKAEVGALSDLYVGLRLRVGEQGIWGWVAQTGESLLSPDVLLEPRAHLVPGEEVARSQLCVPLRTKEAVIGVLSAAERHVGAFDQSDLAVLQSLAHQAAAAIENARLYEQAQRLAVMEERQRLARELHDAVTQTLFSASLISEALPDMWEADPAEGRFLLGELRQLSRGALAEMRTLLMELRPTALVDANLADLLRQLGEAVTGRTGIPVEVSVGVESAFPPDVHVAFYRIAQEALNNVVKHAVAGRVTVDLHCLPGAAGADGEAPLPVQLVIEDDGRGFDPGHVPPERLGLGIIRERAQAIGAALQINSRPGRGTRVAVVWQGQARGEKVESGSRS